MSIVTIMVIIGVSLVLSNFTQLKEINKEAENVDYKTKIIEFEFLTAITSKEVIDIYSGYDLNIIKPDNIRINGINSGVLFYTKDILDKVYHGNTIKDRAVLVGKDIATLGTTLSYNGYILEYDEVMGKGKGISYYDNVNYVPIEELENIKSKKYKVGRDSISIRYKENIDDELNRLITDLKVKHNAVIYGITDISEKDNMLATAINVALDLKTIYKIIIISIITLVVTSITCFSNRVFEVTLKRSVGIPDSYVLKSSIKEILSLAMVNSFLAGVSILTIKEYIYNVFNFKIYYSFREFIITLILAVLIYTITYSAVLLYAYNKEIVALLKEEY